MMRDSVKMRILLAMSALVLVNATSAAVSWRLNATADHFAAQSRTQSRTTHAVERASQRIADFLAEANALALTVARSHVSEDTSVAYGRLLGAESEADKAIRALADGASSPQASAITAEWERLRLHVFLWVNREASDSGSSLRITRDGSGRFRASVQSNLEVPPALEGADEPALRRTARDGAEIMRNATLRSLSVTAERDTAAARAAESRARATAAGLSVAFAVGGLLVAGVVAMWLWRAIATRLEAARRFATQVAEGDLSARLGEHAHDEIGALTHAVETMKDAVVERIDTLREIAGAVLVTADSVGSATRRARDRALESDCTASAVSDLDDALGHVAVLEGLAGQMLND